MQKFEKWQGCGNDFILIDRGSGAVDDSETIKLLCDRHFGIGGDGVIYVLSSGEAAVRMRIFNADGTEAEMCGNGIRCFAKYLLTGDKFFSDDDLTVETGAGILTVSMKYGLVTVDMGEPILTAADIPVTGFGTNKVIAEPITVDGVTYKMTCVSMGNPHCVIFVDDIDAIDLENIGRKFENNKIFPNKINTEFVQVVGENRLRMRVWERGSGITLACGTGACATAVAANLNGLADKQSTVILDGGELNINWHENNHVMMKGAAERVFVGETNLTDIGAAKITANKISEDLW
ncbi:MAG: diaminopimelate epimerase [Selenomonadaceae bacterium]|nr:diaminopimelate epimerase [Selenomonadaceae bacterium]